MGFLFDVVIKSVMGKERSINMPHRAEKRAKIKELFGIAAGRIQTGGDHLFPMVTSSV